MVESRWLTYGEVCPSHANSAGVNNDRKIEQSLLKSLIALYHARIKYPEAKETKIAS
jgi:hypothetical protein